MTPIGLNDGTAAHSLANAMGCFFLFFFTGYVVTCMLHMPLIVVPKMFSDNCYKQYKQYNIYYLLLDYVS